MPGFNPSEFQPSPHPAWTGDLTRVPYWVYRDRELLKAEQERVFEGPVWNYLCLESEIANPGDWRTTMVGQMPVVVVRDKDGSIAAFENRCAHRGALICLDNAGSGAKDFQCVYHAWRYDLRGNLKSVAFQRGVNGRGGMPADFRVEDHGPRKLRTTTLCGLVFGTFSRRYAGYRGPSSAPMSWRSSSASSADRQIEIIGRFVEVLPNNWKMYAENVRDSYHASLLHLFFATFKINRLSQGGGLIVSPNGGCSVSSTIAPTEADDKAYAGMRSVDDDYRLEDPSLIDVVDEHPRPHPPADRHGVPELRRAEDAERHGAAVLHAGRRRPDEPGMDLFRLCRRHAGDAQAPAAASEPGRAGRVSSRWRMAASAALSNAASRRRRTRPRSSRWAAPASKASRRGRPRPRCAGSGRCGAGWSGYEHAAAIAELNAAYAAAIDNDRLEAWPDFFVDDCLYKITSAENHKRGYAAGIVYADSRAMLRDRVTALRTANIYERQSYRHIIGLPLISAHGAGVITAETPFLVARIMRDGRTRSVRHRRLSRQDAR